MSEKLSIAIPTRGRSNKVTTNVLSQILVVDKSEQDTYQDYNPGKDILICPDFNSLAEKRNWIVNYFGDVFMLDDDIEKVINLTDASILSPVQAKNRIEWIYGKALELDIFLFGFNNSPNPTHYNAMKPIMFKGFINGAAMGVRKNDKLKFTSKTVAVEDYYINLMNAYLYRRNLIDKRFCFKQNEAGTFITEGGQSLNRTMQTEMEDSLYLRRLFGDSIILKRERYKPEESTRYARQLNIRI